jgi:DDE_Tnp_1-associated
VVQCRTGSADPAPTVPVPVLDVRGGLLELFSGVPGRVPGGRSGQGKDHPTAAVLALAAAAVVAGMKGYTAITGWVADVSAAVLADLSLRAGAIPAGPPSETTIWRVLTDADPEMFDAAAGTWLMSAAGLAARLTGK